MEIGTNATDVTGYFATTNWINDVNSSAQNNIAHSSNSGAFNTIKILQDNTWFGGDTVGGVAPFIPWADGQFTVPIPAVWWVGTNAPTNKLNSWSQTISITADGTMSVKKFDRSATRTTNNVYTTN